MEMYVYYTIIVFTIIILSLYVYIIWEKTFQRINRKRREKYEQSLRPLIDNTINDMIEGKNPDIITKSRFINTILKNKLKKSIIEDRILFYLENHNGDFANHLIKFCEENGIIDRELKELTKNNVYAKALACKKLGELKSKKAVPYLLKEIDSKSQDITYNALLALAKIGDEDAFLEAFESINSSILLSERSLIEIADSFEGNKNAIYSKMIDSDNEFVSCIFIKSAGNHKDYGLSEKISKFLKSDSKEKIISSIKALGNMSKGQYINEITQHLTNENWEIRAISAKVLGYFNNISVIDKLIDALSDRQWFVRYNAASSILSLDKDLTYISKVFNGQDKFAKDILISAMENSNRLSSIVDSTDSLNENKKNTALLIKNYLEIGGDPRNE